MRLSGRLILAALVLLAGSCSKTTEEEEPLPSMATVRALSDRVTLSPGGQAYAEFSVTPFETQFNYDAGSEDCDISVVGQSGEPIKEFQIVKIEPAGSSYEDHGKYKILLKDALTKFSYSQQCFIALKDDYGRISKSGGFIVSCEGDELTRTLLATGLPLIRIDTDGGVEPTCEYVAHPPGCNGAGIKNATKVPGSMIMLAGESILYSSGPYVKDESGMTLRIRGNTSAYPAKKPFKIKLQKKKDLLRRGDEDKYKDKDWLLLCYDDLRSRAGWKVNQLVGLQWTPGFEYVNLVINGDYRGLYILAESVKRNEKCRLKVSQSGYAIEYDAYWWNENVTFTGDWNYSMQYTFKYPEDDEVTDSQIGYIKDFIIKTESAIRSGDYDKYIDVPSFARWLLGHDILGSLDCAGSNYFLTKYDSNADSKLIMANMWDFDGIYQMKDSWANTHIWRGFYFPALLESGNRLFRETYVEVWQSLSGSLCKNASAYMKSLVNSDEGRALDASIALDNKRWKAGHPSVATSVELSRQWFDTRGGWLNNAIAGLKN
jgi:hypothetical protein